MTWPMQLFSFANPLKYLYQFNLLVEFQNESELMKKCPYGEEYYSFCKLDFWPQDIKWNIIIGVLSICVYLILVPALFWLMYDIKKNSHFLKHPQN